MTSTMSPADAGKRLLSFAHENRLIQGSWHLEINGRQLGCMLYAMSNGVKIDDVTKCPGTLMPQWVARLVLRLFDRQRKGEAIQWAIRFGTQMGHEGWARLPWESVRVEFLVSAMATALESARPRCGKAAYWPKVEEAHRLVREALRGNGDLSIARTAALAARSAAYAAAAAAADAAYAAAAAADAAAAAAYAAAHGKQATMLCDLIDKELVK